MTIDNKEILIKNAVDLFIKKLFDHEEAKNNYNVDYMTDIASTLCHNFFEEKNIHAFDVFLRKENIGYFELNNSRGSSELSLYIAYAMLTILRITGEHEYVGKFGELISCLETITASSVTDKQEEEDQRLGPS